MRKAVKTAKGVWVFDAGHTYFFDKARFLPNAPAAAASGAAADGNIVSPMPGKVFKILVAAGQSVAAGQDVLIVEAMKMEHALKAPFAGRVEACFVKEGEQVELGQKLIVIHPNSQS